MRLSLLIMLLGVAVVSCQDQYMVCKSMNGIFGPTSHNQRANHTKLRGPIGRPGKKGPIGPRGHPGNVNWTQIDRRIHEVVRQYIGELSAESASTRLSSTTRSVTPTTTTSIQCTTGVIYRGRCIWLPVLEGGVVTRSRAERSCTTLGGTLVDIKNREMFNTILNYVRDAYNFEGGVFLYIWLASSYENGRLRWSDGSSATYEKWFPGYPRPYAGSGVATVIRRNPSDEYQGMYNRPPNSYAVPLCITA